MLQDVIRAPTRRFLNYGTIATRDFCGRRYANNFEVQRRNIIQRLLPKFPLQSKRRAYTYVHGGKQDLFWVGTKFWGAKFSIVVMGLSMVAKVKAEVLTFSIV